MAYIDTSVLVACYYPEPLSTAAQEAVREAQGPTISPLTQVEFCSALATKVRVGEMESNAAGRILSAFRRHVEEGRYGVLSIEARQYNMACDWIASFSTPLRTVDALHLAAAWCADLEMVTADKQLARAAKHFGVKCRLVT